MLALMYFFPHREIGSFTLPALPSFHFSSTAKTQNTYIPKRQITNTIIGVTYANISIAKNKLAWWKLWDFDDDFEAMIGTKKTIQEYLNRDIVRMLDTTTDRAATLQSFINQLQFYSNAAENIIDVGKSKVSDREVSFASCASSKNQADAAYLEAVNADDAQAIASILQDAEEYGKCETDFRIKINSYVLPLQELQTIKNAADQYTQVLEQHFDNLIKYYELLRDDVLEELLLVKQQFGL